MSGSMGRVGACGDNAAMESFFALLQRNVLDRRPWATRAELRLAIVQGIKKIYRCTGRQRRIGRVRCLMAISGARGRLLRPNRACTRKGGLTQDLRYMAPHCSPNML